ncbi:MAG TPA: S8 family serine peptidase [Ignavibacteria bacterium]|nr:S8 family serine peptidase [Ignavibacteria bacterium]
MKKELKFCKVTFLILAVFCLLSLTGSNNFTNNFKISKNLSLLLNDMQQNEKVLIWISFTDKGENSSSLLADPETLVTKRSLDRRKKVKPAGKLVDLTDIPVSRNYISDLQNSGIEVKQKSRWFNRISCYADKDQINNIVSKDYINGIDIVMKFRKKYDDAESGPGNEFLETDGNNNQNGLQYALNYGTSETQMEMINAPMGHDSGYYGQGIIIASFDAGVDNLEHPCFDSLRARGIRTFDFVNNDTIVADQTGQMGAGWHGTMTLSLAGGYRPGSLISPAFRSHYIIAKTENTDSETPLEEDNWIAAAEWADSLGADIITSSLGYLGMDNGSSHSYNWTWMNGDSCFLTIAADLAVNKGILVINSAGNEGSHASHNTIMSPADGDSVIAVGSVTSSSTRSSFSSVGLTIDGRIKPDIMAMGSNNKIAQTGSGNTGYSSGSGTSFSCPMTAGACAMILSANPDLTPIQVREILYMSADNYNSPDRFYGYGIINTWEAIKLALPKKLNLTAVIEGLYDANSNTMAADTVTANIRSSSSPYNILDQEKGVLNSNGTLTLEYGNVNNGVNYYLQILHRNALETWSKNTQSFISNVLNYNFTAAAVMAFGDNMLLKGSKWVFYSGDVNSDKSVDLGDLSIIDNDANDFLTGYNDSDLNGDGLTDIADLLYADNNAGNFVVASTP